MLNKHVKQKVDQKRVIGSGRGVLDDTLLTAYVQEIMKCDRLLSENEEGVLWRENCKLQPFRQFGRQLFDRRQQFNSDSKSCRITDNI